MLTLNVWLKSTSVFDNAEETDYQDAKKNPIIIWQYRDGFQKNINKIRNEFKLYRGLETVKAVILGPTASGKTFNGKQ
jgi:adenylate kinase